MPVDYLVRIRNKYVARGYTPYRWVVNEDPPPWHPPAKPLSHCKLGLVASGGIYVTGQVAFHYNDDTSFRAIPRDTETKDLRATHFAYNLADARSDPNVVFPIDTLRGLVREGFIGELAPHLYGFMGGIYSARRLLEELAPKLSTLLLAEKVDVLLLVPV